MSCGQRNNYHPWCCDTESLTKSNNASAVLVREQEMHSANGAHAVAPSLAWKADAGSNIPQLEWFLVDHDETKVSSNHSMWRIHRSNPLMAKQSRLKEQTLRKFNLRPHTNRERIARAPNSPPWMRKANAVTMLAPLSLL